MPKFTIVIPVKTGKVLLEKCITSILQQTNKDYDVVVLTDIATKDAGIVDWLQSLRIENLRIIHTDENINIQENWDRIRAIEKGEYFTILGYDDILYPDYLDVMLALIGKHPDATLYQAHYDFIDDDGVVIEESKRMRETFSSTEYLASVLRCEYYIMATGYMIRSSDYEKIGGISADYPNILFADYELWIRLASLGYFAVSPEKCFAFRIHQSTTKVSSDRKMLHAFGRLVTYLSSLTQDPACYQIVQEHGAHFLKYHLNFMLYRLIRKEKSMREGISVNNMLTQFQEFGAQLGLRNIDFLQMKTIKVAWYIDRFGFTRNAYLLLKKMVKKPLMVPTYK
ncbi:MAG TPA: glycosyltransferase [Chitinophagaceae bacterium]|jgi:GT2 family glycosyltransferase|nr:glycosyltransferase [Chitinophagaceae bacterium]